MEQSDEKRNLQRTDAEEQVDRAATEIVDLVEQDAQHSARSLTGSSTPLDMHTLSTSMDTSAMLRSAGTEQEEEAVIPEWVITESREMNREVTPPAQLFFEIRGKDNMVTVGRRQSLAQCTIYTVRQGHTGGTGDTSSISSYPSACGSTHTTTNTT